MSDAALPATMTVIEITEAGGPDVLQPAKRPTPTPGHGEILVKVAAAGVNRPDIMQRQGSYPVPPGASDLPGLEVSGTVAALGAGVDQWRVGDEVCALTPGGGYAEYCLTHASHALPAPAGLSLTEAGAMPETFFTVWTNVFDRGRLQAGERLLVHGGSSGIGTTAIQIADALGARVFATAGSKEKCVACENLGAERAINYREKDFVAVIRDLTDGEGVDVILDMVGGDYFQRNLAVLRAEGRLVQIAFLGGNKANVDLMSIMRNRLTVTGSTLRPQSIEAKAQIAESLRRTVWPLVEAGRVKPVIHAKFPLAEASRAHHMMEEGNHIGKIVLEV
jgi:putative PIG3 family NAD(P)H quinone oxidoreductase